MTRAKCRCICQFYFICLLIVLKIPLRWNILITGSWIDGRIFLSRKSFVLRLANLFEAIIQYSIACQMNSIVCVMLYFFFIHTVHVYWFNQLQTIRNAPRVVNQWLFQRFFTAYQSENDWDLVGLPQSSRQIKVILYLCETNHAEILVKLWNLTLQ